jgi:uncharacterized protein (DUF2126 family)
VSLIDVQDAKYTQREWAEIRALGDAVDCSLVDQGVQLWMGGEPTFVSASDFDSAQWQTAALGDDKRRLAERLLHRLVYQYGRFERFDAYGLPAPLVGPGGVMHYGSGKLYPGEMYPRWAIGYFWRTDGLPMWCDPLLMANDRGLTTLDVAREFVDRLVGLLGIASNLVMTAQTVSPGSTGKMVGYVVPLVSTYQDQQTVWSSCEWSIARGSSTGLELELAACEEEVAIGLRLPLYHLPMVDDLASEQSELPAAPLGFESQVLPLDSVRVALTVEVRCGTLYVFLPPIASDVRFLTLVHAIELTAESLNCPVRLEGFAPPVGDRIRGFQITPDPGVIEVNIHPAESWVALVALNEILEESAVAIGLTTTKFSWDGRCLSTGGGAHLTLGGASPELSPFLRRPDLLRSLITCWQRHPSLSYLFADVFVGPTSQAPRIDEGRFGSLYELEIALGALESGMEAETIDRLLSNLLVDGSGNAHRSEFCVDKLFPADNVRGRWGVLEMRAFAMPMTAQMRMVQILLLRALVAKFWQTPCQESLVRWGTTLHDRFLLPHFIREDLNEVLGELNDSGFEFDLNWFEPFFASRFPIYGEVKVASGEHRLSLELRHAIEIWNVVGDSVGASRTVDASMERVQIVLRGTELDGNRFRVICNGYPVPLQRSREDESLWVGSVRFRARTIVNAVHPAIHPHAPLVIEVVDVILNESLGGCTYHVLSPDGVGYEGLPKSMEEADRRMDQRFVNHLQVHSLAELPIVVPNVDYPLTLDLRRC